MRWAQPLSDDEAVRSGTEAGIVFVVAAGNEAADASSSSPAREPSAITVSALADSDGQPGGYDPATSYGADDSFANFSNDGTVVDIWAPGVDILSTYLGGAGGTCVIATPAIKNTKSSVTSTMTGVTAAGFIYNPSANHDETDSDSSNGTTITVNKP